jgi:3-deoxy-D-manno-octulosonic-acid transferase
MEAKQQKIPLVIVNGRISDRSFPRYRMAAKLLSPVLDSIADFCMQSEQDSRRIRHLGAPAGRVRVTGNLKFDMQLPDIAVDDVPLLRTEYRIANDAVVWVAGSTHEGEESQVIETYLRLRQVCPKLLLVLVPRHPERSRGVVDELNRQGVHAVLRSELSLHGRALSSGESLVVDTLGEMLSLYALSNLVFVGGSLVPVGGHNVLEASLARKPVLFGPHMNNFKEIARLLKAAHGGLQVKDKEDLFRQMKILLENPSEAERIGDNGKFLLESNQGATEKTLKVISRHL